MNKLNLEAGLAAVDRADSLDSAQKDATKRILRAFAGAEQEKPRIYERGDKFGHHHGTATLTCVGGSKMLMTFNDGYWGGVNGGTNVNDVLRITEAELEKICGGSRSKYTRKEKKDD